MSDRETLDKAKEYALSNFDIQGILEPDTKIFKYAQLKDARNIDELLDRNGRAIMLYDVLGENNGHWIAILRKGDTIEFFDTYASNPGKIGKSLGVDPKQDAQWGQDKDLLKDIVKRSGYKLIWNKKQIQPKSPGVNTCGRHAVLRLLFGKYTMPEYLKILKEIQIETGISADDLATHLTMNSIGK